MCSFDSGRSKVEVLENTGREAGVCSQDEEAESHVTDVMKSKCHPDAGRAREVWKG